MGYIRSDSLVNDSWKWIFCEAWEIEVCCSRTKGRVKYKWFPSLSMTVGSGTFARLGKLEDVVLRLSINFQVLLDRLFWWEIVQIEQV